MNNLIRSGLRAMMGLGVMLAALGTPVEARADEAVLRVQLLWGSSNPDFAQNKSKFEKIDPKLEKRLKQVFRWRHYWEEKEAVHARLPIRVNAGETQVVRIKEKTSLVISYLGEEELEVKLLTRQPDSEKDQLLVNKSERLHANGLIILASEAENENAWLVLVSNFP